MTSCLGCVSSSSRDKDRIAELEAQIAELQSSNSTIHTAVEETAVEEAPSSDYQSLISGSATSTSSNTSKSNGSSIVGTYQFTDELNHTWVLVANTDETATISTKDGNNLCYGSWHDFRVNDDGIDFSFTDEVPVVYFPSGSERCMSFNLRDDGYIYRSRSDAKAKNPRKRLPVKKVK